MLIDKDAQSSLWSSNLPLTCRFLLFVRPFLNIHRLLIAFVTASVKGRWTLFAVCDSVLFCFRYRVCVLVWFVSQKVANSVVELNCHLRNAVEDLPCLIVWTMRLVRYRYGLSSDWSDIVMVCLQRAVLGLFWISQINSQFYHALEIAVKPTTLSSNCCRWWCFFSVQRIYK